MKGNFIIDKESFVFQLLETGIGKSADSLAIMINHEVEVSNLEMGLFSEDIINQELLLSDDNILILKTELVGSISGMNYLLLNQHELKIIYNNCMTEELDAEVDMNMTIEFLKEIENVLAATCISQIADTFNINLFGDVPKIQAVKSGNLDRVIAQEVSQLGPMFETKCDFDIKGLGITPHVMWFFDQSFVERLKNNVEPKLVASV